MNIKEFTELVITKYLEKGGTVHPDITLEIFQLIENNENLLNDYQSLANHYKEVNPMETAKIFSNGGSQAVRLPKTCRFNDSEVLVNRIGNIVILFPKEDRWQSLLTSLDLFTEDFLAEEIKSLPVEDREVII